MADMIDLRTRIYVDRDAVRFGNFVRGYITRGPGQENPMELAEPLTWGPYVAGHYSEPTFRLDAAQAQELMDGLWSCGLRPTQGQQSEGVTAAQARHLEDMRALAFTKLGVEKP